MSSSLRAKSEANPRAASSTWTWSFPGAPVSINLPLSLITRLRVAIADQSASRAEMGGLLLGSVGKTPDTIDIHDYVCIPSTTQSDADYTLKTSDLERLRWQNTGYGFDKNGARQYPVIGYFRTQSQGTLELRGPEVDLIKEHFPDPSNVVLLIQTRQNTAGFFCWYEDIFTPFSFKDFPFDAVALRPDLVQSSSSVRPPLPEPAQAVKTVTARVENERRLPQNRQYLAISAAVLALVGLSGFLFWDRRPPTPVAPQQTQSTPASVDSIPVALEVEAQQNGLNIRWNPRSTLVRDASEGRLVILKQNQDAEIAVLDSEQLASGHVYYQSPEKRLGFRLELVDNSGRVARESVLAL